MLWGDRSTRVLKKGIGHPDTVAGEADDVGSPRPAYVRKLAGVEVLAAPTAGIGTKVSKLERGGSKVPARSGQGHVDTGSAEADDVGSAVTVYVCKFARVGVVAAPTASIGTKVSELERGAVKEALCNGQGHVDTGRAEADDVG